MTEPTTTAWKPETYPTPANAAEQHTFVHDPYGFPDEYSNDVIELPNTIQIPLEQFANIVGLVAGLQTLVVDPPTSCDPALIRDNFVMLERIVMAAAVANGVRDHAGGWEEGGMRTAGFSALGFVSIDSDEGRQILADMETAADFDGDGRGAVETPMP